MKLIKCTKCMMELEESVRICPYCGYDQQEDSQPENALRRNMILHGRYLIGNVIGQGGFGITYVGFDLVLEMKVAIKEYFPMATASRTGSYSSRIQWDDRDEGEHAAGMERFVKEARKMAKLDAVPSIVRVWDVFLENDTAYIVMDYVEGVTLKEYLREHGVMRAEQCLSLLEPILESLAVMHERGFIHRDISPDNIMIQPDGTARLLDMGAAVDVRATHGQASMAVAKKNFSAPEQYLDSETLENCTDVYAMAATIYYCLTGRVVPEAMKRLYSGTQLTFPEEAQIPADVAAALTRALELKKSQRTADMREFRRQLETAGAEAPREAVRGDTGSSRETMRDGAADEDLLKEARGRLVSVLSRIVEENQKIHPDSGSDQWSAAQRETEFTQAARSHAGTGAEASPEKKDSPDLVSESERESVQASYPSSGKKKRMASIGGIGAVVAVVIIVAVMQGAGGVSGRGIYELSDESGEMAAASGKDEELSSSEKKTDGETDSYGVETVSEDSENDAAGEITYTTETVSLIVSHKENPDHSDLFNSYTYEYDEFGNTTKETAYTSDGEIVYCSEMSYEYSYAINGYLLKEESISWNELESVSWETYEYEYEYEYEFDADGNITKELANNLLTGSMEYWIEYEYNTEGSTERGTYYESEGTVDSYWLCEEDALTGIYKITTYYDSGITEIKEISYDEFGHEVSAKITGDNENYETRSENTYDSDGHILTSTCYCDDMMWYVAEYEVREIYVPVSE